VFWPIKSSSEVAGVPEDSKFPLLGVWVSSSHLPQSGVATTLLSQGMSWKVYFEFTYGHIKTHPYFSCKNKYGFFLVNFFCSNTWTFLIKCFHIIEYYLGFWFTILSSFFIYRYDLMQYPHIVDIMVAGLDVIPHYVCWFSAIPSIFYHCCG
jgi:hypothetical protein